jgi:hypothetical protein
MGGQPLGRTSARQLNWRWKVIWENKFSETEWFAHSQLFVGVRLLAQLFQNVKVQSASHHALPLRDSDVIFSNINSAFVSVPKCKKVVEPELSRDKEMNSQSRSCNLSQSGYFPFRCILIAQLFGEYSYRRYDFEVAQLYRFGIAPYRSLQNGGTPPIVHLWLASRVNHQIIMSIPRSISSVVSGREAGGQVYVPTPIWQLILLINAKSCRWTLHVKQP